MTTTRTTAKKSNRYRAQCGTCRVWTAPGGGTIAKRAGRWVVTCGSCSGDSHADDALSGAYTVGARRGMCEDAPCCGCCGPGSDDPAWSPYYGEDRYDRW
jgi:hypothetical protein